MANDKVNGTADAGIELSTIPPVVGINFGNSYASIAVFTKVRKTTQQSTNLTQLYRKD